MANNRKTFDKRFSILVGLQIAILVSVFIVNKFKNYSQVPNVQSLEDFRSIGNKLETSGLLEQAARYYEKHMTFNASETPESKSKLLFHIGELYEKEGKWEKALAQYYRVKEIINKGSIYDESSKRIVAILDRLKKFQAADRELKNNTTLEKDKNNSNVQQGGVVLAKIGERNIYRHDFEKALDSIPPALRGQFNTPMGKKQFLQKFVADELLYDKAQKQALDKDEEVRKTLLEYEKQLMVQKLLTNELGQKVNIDAGDVQNYFKANEVKYSKPEERIVTLIKVKEKKESDLISSGISKKENFSNLAKKYSKLEDKTFNLQKESSNYHVPSDIIEKVFNGNLNEVSGPHLIQGHFYFFKIDNIQAPFKKKFEEVQKQVEMDYQREKTTNAYQKLVDETLKTEKVQFFWEKLDS